MRIIILAIAVLAGILADDSFIDDRRCPAQANTKSFDPWHCVCHQFRFERDTCESKINSWLLQHPNMKFCIDQPSYYIATNRRCSYESEWEYSNDASGKALKFALKLFNAVDKTRPNQNVIISPLSPQILLAQLIDGCSEKAKLELIRAIYLNNNEVNALVTALNDVSSREGSSNKLEIASAYFKSPNMELTPKFTSKRKENKISITDVNFASPASAAQVINSWANEKTRGNIPKVVTEGGIPTDTLLMLLNAIYFKGNWLYRFNTTETEVRSFEVAPEQKVDVPMMSQSNRFRYGELHVTTSEAGFRWVELPYEGDQMAMILMLPTERHKLDETLTNFDFRKFQTIFKTLRRNYNPIKMNVTLPKFTLTDSVSLVNPLKELGVSLIFGDNNALSGLSTIPSKVDDVKQDTFLSIDEAGTKAAAVTKVTIVPLSLNSYEDTLFLCDEPFLAIIIDKTREVPLFMAKIQQPSSGPVPIAAYARIQQ